MQHLLECGQGLRLQYLVSKITKNIRIVDGQNLKNYLLTTCTEPDRPTSEVTCFEFFCRSLTTFDLILFKILPPHLYVGLRYKTPRDVTHRSTQKLQ